MKYQILDEAIPQNYRKQVNDKILQCVAAQSDTISPAQIFNAYTGVGGLHGLEFSNYPNFAQYTKHKQEIEQGQFFTPPILAKDICEIVGVKSNELVLDPTCGVGVFCNFLPVESNFFGIELDPHATQVAKWLYQDATILEGDLRYQTLPLKFDVILGNPPFNLRWCIDGHNVVSQRWFLRKAAEWLKQGGVLAVIVPKSYLDDGVYFSKDIELINEHFNFIGQLDLGTKHFEYLGVKGYSVKALFLQRKSEHLQDVDFENIYISPNTIQTKLAERYALRAKLNVSNNKVAGNNNYSIKNYRLNIQDELGDQTKFEFLSRKYIYEIKQHPHLKKHYTKVLIWKKELEQDKPNNVDWKTWNKTRLTPKKFLSRLERIIKNQNKPTKKEKEPIRLVHTKYGLKLKGRVPAKVNKFYAYNDLVDNPELNISIPYKCDVNYSKIIKRKQRFFKMESTSLIELAIDKEINKWLDTFTFLDKNGAKAKFNEIQKQDINKHLQRLISINNWQQGGGKTLVGYAFICYMREHYPHIRKFFITAPSLATQTTWTDFLTKHKEAFVLVNKPSDLNKDGILVISYDCVIKKAKNLDNAYYIKHQLKKLVKRISQKGLVVFDEVDELNSNTSIRSKAMRAIFRRLKFKLATTGTITRNNATELYPILELMTNNSLLMTNKCEYIYSHDKNGVLQEIKNLEQGQPFKAYKGFTSFKSCFNPEKTSVFGIGKHDQDIYNEKELRSLLERMVITRSFAEIAGSGKYTHIYHKVSMSAPELEVYRVILEEFGSIYRNYFASTGSSRKEAALRIIRQITLLRKACSMPQTFFEYESPLHPTKYAKIEKLVKKWSDQKVCIGCTWKDTAAYYAEMLQRLDHKRKVYLITGDLPIQKRRKLVKQFEAATDNPILVCTQQSLKSSVNIPSCDKVILESLQWNLPKISQFYHRFIRFDSKNHTEVHFITYADSIEQNIMALLLTKEKINRFVKNRELLENEELFSEYDVDLDILNSLLERHTDQETKRSYIKWGGQKIN